MKRYLTAIFIGLSVLTLVIGLRFDVIWSGIVSWGLVVILLTFAAFFSLNIFQMMNKRNMILIHAEIHMNERNDSKYLCNLNDTNN